MRIGSKRREINVGIAIIVGAISCGVAGSKSASQDSWRPNEPLRAALEEPAAAQLQTKTPDALPPTNDPHGVVAGDSLRIDFFDRKDLSAVYRVRPDGQISLPLIGPVYVKDKTLGQVEVELAGDVREVTDRAISVTVETVERPPIYTVGFISKPNAYAYVDNMTVLHALALGGGLYRALGESGLAIGDVEASRESGQLKQTLDVLKRSLAQLARLRSERDGKAIIEPDGRLLELSSKAEADELVKAEARVMREQTETLNTQLGANARALQIGQEELRSLQEQVNSNKSEINLYRKDLGDLDQLKQKGLTTNQRLRDMQRMIAQREADARLTMASISRVESNLTNLSRDQELLTSERKLKIESEINALEEKIAQSENAVRSSRGLISKYTGMTVDSRMSVASPRVVFKIVRGGVEGRRIVIDATETTPLFPGDIVQFILADEQVHD
jgi:polysaccharide biosynthesis/export protein ExoF